MSIIKEERFHVPKLDDEWIEKSIEKKPRRSQFSARKEDDWKDENRWRIFRNELTYEKNSLITFLIQALWSHKQEESEMSLAKRMAYHELYNTLNSFN